MTIPKFNELFNKVLEDLADGQEWRAKDFYEHVIDGLNLPEAERSEKGGEEEIVPQAVPISPASIFAKLVRLVDPSVVTFR